jgi:hypothetical protein
MAGIGFFFCWRRRRRKGERCDWMRGLLEKIWWIFSLVSLWILTCPFPLSIDSFLSVYLFISSYLSSSCSLSFYFILSWSFYVVLEKVLNSRVYYLLSVFSIFSIFYVDEKKRVKNRLWHGFEGRPWMLKMLTFNVNNQHSLISV